MTLFSLLVKYVYRRIYEQKPIKNKRIFLPHVLFIHSKCYYHLTLGEDMNSINFYIIFWSEHVVSLDIGSHLVVAATVSLNGGRRVVGTDADAAVGYFQRRWFESACRKRTACATARTVIHQTVLFPV